MNISRSNECGIMKILTVFPLLVGGSAVRIFCVLRYVGTNSLFQFVGTDFKTAGIVKGLLVPLLLGFQ